MKKLNVNRDACIGCGLCNASYPDAFVLDDENIAECVAELEDDVAEEAINACPAAAIEE